MTGVGRGREEWRPGQAQVTGGLGRTVLDVENPLRGHRQNSPKPSHGPPRHPTRRYQTRTPDPPSGPGTAHEARGAPRMLHPKHSFVPVHRHVEQKF